MKVTQKSLNGFCVQVVKGRDHATKIPPLAPDMLHLALATAGVAEGTFSYQVTGYCHNLQATSMHAMRIAPGRGRNIRVHMKCGKSSNSTVTGLLHPPASVELLSLTKRLTEASLSLNSAQWKSLWPKKDEGPMDVPPTEHMVHHDQDVTTQPADGTPAPTASRPDPEEAQVVHTDVKAGLVNDEYSSLLIKIIQSHAGSNGVFRASDVKKMVYDHFPSKSQQGLLMGTLFKMAKAGWIQLVSLDSAPAWQVTESFLHGRGIGITISPLAAKPLGRKKGARKASKAKPVVAKRSSKPKATKVPKVAKPKPRVAGVGKGTKSKLPITRLKELKVEEQKLEKALAAVRSEIAKVSKSLTKEDLLKLLLG